MSRHKQTTKLINMADCTYLHTVPFGLFYINVCTWPSLDGSGERLVDVFAFLDRIKGILKSRRAKRRNGYWTFNDNSSVLLTLLTNNKPEKRAFETVLQKTRQWMWVDLRCSESHELRWILKRLEKERKNQIDPTGKLSSRGKYGGQYSDLKNRIPALSRRKPVTMTFPWWSQYRMNSFHDLPPSIIQNSSTTMANASAIWEEQNKKFWHYEWECTFLLQGSKGVTCPFVGNFRDFHRTSHNFQINLINLLVMPEICLMWASY